MAMIVPFLLGRENLHGQLPCFGHHFLAGPVDAVLAWGAEERAVGGREREILFHAIAGQLFLGPVVPGVGGVETDPTSDVGEGYCRSHRDVMVEIRAERMVGSGSDVLKFVDRLLQVPLWCWSVGETTVHLDRQLLVVGAAGPRVAFPRDAGVAVDDRGDLRASLCYRPGNPVHIADAQRHVVSERPPSDQFGFGLRISGHGAPSRSRSRPPSGA